jgi:hypothetical protein
VVDSLFIFVCVACVADSAAMKHQLRKLASCEVLAVLALGFLLNSDDYFCVDRLVSDGNVDWHVVLPPFVFVLNFYCGA